MILFYLKESFSYLFRAKLASFIIIITTSIALIFTTLSISLLLLSGRLDHHLKSQIEIKLFIDDSLSASVITNLNSTFLNDKYVASVKFIDKDEAIKNFNEEIGENLKTILEANPLPRSFSVRLKPEYVSEQNFESVISVFKNKAGITDVVYDYSLTLKLLDFIRSAKTVIYIVATILIILSIYLVYSNNRLLQHNREEQINIMKLVGAKLNAIKLPIIFNGIIIGLFASFICIILTGIIYYLFSKIYINISIMEFYYLLIMYLVLGIILGYLGSLLSIRKVSLKIDRH